MNEMNNKRKFQFFIFVEYNDNKVILYEKKNIKTIISRNCGCNQTILGSSNC